MPIPVPALRERGEDVVLLFRKFASDFAEKYRMPAIQLTEDVYKRQIISTLVILVTGEFLPKTLFTINPNLVLRVFATPLFLSLIHI